MHAFGDELIAPANGIELCYQEMGDADGEPLLLVMGLATQMLAWDEGFCGLLVERGFRVIRFDNRDIGRSTKIESAGVPRRLDMMAGRRASAPYLLRDLAADTVGLMDHLDVESAHIAGASMGGMIGQVLAAEHPEIVRSLTSIMSNTGSRWNGHPAPAMLRWLLKAPPSTRDQVVDRAAAIFGIVGSKDLHDEEHIREMAGRSYDRNHDPRGPGRQLGAIIATGDRGQMLSTIEAPTLVIHGTRDKLVRPSGGKATAKAIPDSRLKKVEGMGHDLPRPLWDELIADISRHAKAADSAGVRPSAAAVSP